MMLGGASLLGCGSEQEATQPAKASAQPATSGKVKGSHVLVAYFSWGGNTRRRAQKVQELTGADMFEIKPAKPYPTKYEPTTKVAKTEREENARPEVASRVSNMEGYDTILLGYPIWWHDTPKLIDTFLESYELSGKKIAPFCTSGGSPLEESLPTLEQLDKQATLLPGLTANDMDSIEPWLRQLSLV
ncbi:flavodoxin [Colibacter massiliensis]|uniref:flavodoxin n=1 Tax=Colibacter massiliensis TaxID=1852379 RepID=UPI003F91D56D